MNVPILTRSACFTKIQGGTSKGAPGTHRHLDFNIVTTTLGIMIEPRTLYRPGENMKQDDIKDSDYTDIRVLTKADAGFFANTPLFANQWPKTF